MASDGVRWADSLHDRLLHAPPIGDEMREAERDAKICRYLRSVIRTAEHPHIRHRRAAWLRDDVAERMAFHQLFA
jgi:hypothetical protein